MSGLVFFISSKAWNIKHLSFFSFFLKNEFQLFCHPSHYSRNLQPLLLGKDHRGNLLLTLDLLSSMEIPLEENMQESTLAVESEFLLSQICCCLYLSQPDDSEFIGPLSCLGMRLCCISAHSYSKLATRLRFLHPKSLSFFLSTALPAVLGSKWLTFQLTESLASILVLDPMSGYIAAPGSPCRASPSIQGYWVDITHKCY